MKKSSIIILFSLMLSIATISAQSPKVMISDSKGWHKIGETTVSFKKEEDEIQILGKDRFTAILFKVNGAPIHLVNAIIYSEDGLAEAVEVNTPVQAPGESKIISLTGGERRLKRIVFIYN